MCGIVGFIGQEQAAPILLDGLAHLEYRGYDSAGVAVISAQGKLQVEKAVGRLKVLSEQIHGGADLEGCIGLGHTRWATHCLLYTSPSPRDGHLSRMPSSA